MTNIKNVMFTFTCDDWRGCHQDLEVEQLVDVDDPVVEFEVQCDLCGQWHHYYSTSGHEGVA